MATTKKPGTTTTTTTAAAPETAARPKPRRDRAPANTMFVCLACGRAFHDRAATEPMEVMYDRHVPAETIRRHTAAARISGGELPVEVDAGAGADGSVEGEAYVPAQPAQDCCPGHTKLHSTQTMRVRKNDDGSFEIVGARALE